MEGYLFSTHKSETLNIVKGNFSIIKFIFLRDSPILIKSVIFLSDKYIFIFIEIRFKTCFMILFNEDTY